MNSICRLELHIVTFLPFILLCSCFNLSWQDPVLKHSPSCRSQIPCLAPTTLVNKADYDDDDISLREGFVSVEPSRLVAIHLTQEPWISSQIQKEWWVLACVSLQGLHLRSAHLKVGDAFVSFHFCKDTNAHYKHTLLFDLYFTHLNMPVCFVFCRRCLFSFF